MHDKPLGEHSQRTVNTSLVHVNRKFEAAISAVLVLVAVLVGSLGLCLTMESWQSSPLIVIAILAWGASCIGLRRLLRGKDN